MINKLRMILALCFGLSFVGVAACDDEAEEIEVEESNGEEEVGEELEETGEEIEEEVD